MSDGRYVLVRCILGAEILCIRLAIEAQCLVVRVVYVLITGTLGMEDMRTGLAFQPVVIVVYKVL
jgi:hypothetical protein